MASYDITKIPGIMRHKGWIKGAMLMEGWFARPANDKPEAGTPDTSTITMDWALGFSRARKVYDGMIQERVWVNPLAQREIAKALRDHGKLTGQEARFGERMDDVARLDPSYVQFRVVGSVFDPADDMKAALGRFTFRVAVAGKVVPKTKGGGYTVVLEHIGIYVRDSYDFNGDQLLGSWSDTDFAGAFNPLGGTEVGNSDFRAWRATNHRGGDFLVYSDVRVLQGGDRDRFDI